MTFNEKQLQEIGLSPGEISEFIKMEARGDYAAQIEILRKYRFRVLDNVHEKEHCIQKIDYIIHEINKKIEISNNREVTK